MQRVYCTHFDSQFLTRGIAMIRSLRRFDACAEIRVLALDSQGARIVGEVFGPAVKVVTAETLVDRWPELREVRRQRTLWEYYATQKPLGIVCAIEEAPPGSVVAFIDADAWFFSDPEPLFVEFGANSIGLSPHRYSADLREYAECGEYNAGCILFQADEEGIRCARDWARDCLDWCEERTDAQGRHMNQGYLRQWPERYSGVHILRHPGVNLAPWNVENHVLARDGAGVAVDDRPLIFFHFSGLVPGAGGVWHSFHAHRHRQLEFLRENLYEPYLAELDAEGGRLQRLYGTGGAGSVREDLAIGPGVLKFRSTRGIEDTEAARRDDVDTELSRHRDAVRRLVDAGMCEAALLALRTCGPPLRDSRAEWEYYVAFCLHSLGREPEAALEHYSEALQEGYEEFWVRFHRGQLLLRLGSLADASRDLERALELRPEHEGLADLMRTVVAGPGRRFPRFWRRARA